MYQAQPQLVTGFCCIANKIFGSRKNNTVQRLLLPLCIELQLIFLWNFLYLQVLCLRKKWLSTKFSQLFQLCPLDILEILVTQSLKNLSVIFKDLKLTDKCIQSANSNLMSTNRAKWWIQTSWVELSYNLNQWCR